MRETQYEIIKKLHRATDWVCANTYRDHCSPYYWKRQGEMAKMLGLRRRELFVSRPCEHGTKRGLDWRMLEVAEKRVKIESSYRPDYLKKLAEEKQRIL